MIVVPEKGSFPHRSPGLTDVRDEHKPRFVSKSQRGPQSLSFFLSPATCVSSKGRWPLRLFPRPSVPASGNSTSAPSSTTRHARDDSAPQNAFGSRGRSAAASTDRWRTLRRELPSPGGAKVSLSAPSSAWGAGPASAGIEAPPGPSFGRPGTNGPRSSKKTPASWPRSDNCVPFSAKQ